jgi:isoleucyl-tRNA synthetase
MLRWMAPFLSFTAEEAWKVFAPQAGSGTIFTETYWQFPPTDDALLGKWSRIREVREAVNKAIEDVRTTGAIGSSLQARVALSAAAEDEALLRALGDDLKFVLITSQAEVKPGSELQVQVTPSDDAKCERCWHYRPDVGSDPAHPAICGRCVSNLYGAGEPRTVA